ncbi:Ig-like domain-containing protein [Paenibacillus sp. YIM B09110]|uniref:Ig-like domain-containing protein n=1 Tax=Paenibacillus sp. YIM B09110 TaxID=3126102 RepID=UPI00301DC8B9
MLVLLSAILLFAVMPAAATAADDLSAEEKYRFLVNEGIFTGFADGSSQLYTTMTREQFAAVLFRLWDLTEDSSKAIYTDVLKTRWSYGEIQAVSRAGLMQGVGKGKFSPTSNVTIEQLATVLVRGYGASGEASNTVYGSVSSWAKRDVGVALNKGWITPQSDYRTNALRSQLVQAAYSVYIDMNPDQNPEREKLEVNSVVSISNNVLLVDLRKSVKEISLDQFKLRDDYGRDVRIQRASLSDFGTLVTLTTDKQTSGKTYRLTVDGDTWSYKVYESDPEPPRDTTKPRITSSKITSEAKIELVFSEQITESSAENWSNYRINNNLDITGIDLSSDRKKVTITTEKQESGTVYTLTVKNIKDHAGNTMDSRSDLYFGAVVDRTAPAVTKFTQQGNKIVITFSEALDSGTANDEDNYDIDGGLDNPTRATYNEDDKTVTLTTTNQTRGKKYTLTINGVKDKAGNAIAANTKLVFAGEGSYESPAVSLQSIIALNENTIEVDFNRSLAGISLSTIDIDIVTDNGNSVSMSGWRVYTSLKPGDDTIIRVQFATRDNGNPSLFKQGHVYVAKVTGLPGLETANNANSARFAGVDEANGAPYVTRIVPVNATAVTVYFSEPVKNVSADSFRLKDDRDDAGRINSDQLNDKNRIVTEATLNLGDRLTNGIVYRMSFVSGITDAAGWNGLVTKQGDSPYVVSFQGIDQQNGAPTIQGVTVKDRYNFEIIFSEPVTGADNDVYSLYNESDKTNVRITDDGYALYELSADRQKVTVHLNTENAGPLRQDRSYKLSYEADDEDIADLQGKLIEHDAAVYFSGSDRDNARPYITAVDGWSTGLYITLSETVKGNPAGAFEIVTASGKKLSPSTATLQGNVVTLKLPTTSVGTVVGVKFSAQGAESLLDLNGQQPVVETIFYTVR